MTVAPARINGERLLRFPKIVFSNEYQNKKPHNATKVYQNSLGSQDIIVLVEKTHFVH
jgi:hypothetical protein